MSHNPSTQDSFIAQRPRRNRGTINLTEALGQRVRSALHHWRKHRAVRTLRQLDDRTLGDIGLSRNDIRRFVGDIPVPAPSRISSGRTASSARPHPREQGRYLDTYLSWRDL